MKRKLIAAAVFLAVGGSQALAQDHESRFEFTRAFLEDWAHHPVRDMQATLDCAGPVHPADQDCELHIGAQLADPSIGDFQGIVLEPPSICEDGGSALRAKINALKKESCVGRGFLRAWPEHLTSGSGCSNPNHILEVHPLLKLTCGSHEPMDFASKLHIAEGLGYKAPAIVNNMLTLRLWLCRTCTPSGGELAPIAFDYCFGKQCTRGAASNFARLKTRIITSTIRPEQGKTIEGFATAIARVQPIDAAGQAAGSKMQLLKLYALEGSEFYQILLGLRGNANTNDRDLIGIFTIDPFSILKALEKQSQDEWETVPYPVALVVFGSQ